MENCSVVDLFCGVGALTYGFILEGLKVVAGFDIDQSCQYAYETNNRGVHFIHKKIEDTATEEILGLYPKDHVRVLVGCAPCQPYSTYTKKKQDKGEKWKLLARFADLICEVDPEVVSMENVPELVTFRKGAIYKAFIDKLEAHGYHVTPYPEVYCPDYGIPQVRTRLVLFASKFGEIEITEKTHSPDQYKTVWQTIGHLESIKAGQTSTTDPLHKASGLSELNLRRIKASIPGGTWRDWDEELVAKCHLKETGEHYSSVYGRMKWCEPSPTITTQCHGFGNGRFGHPEQDRAISLREAALLQTFPESYQFVPPNAPHHFSTIGRFIGNAVPVDLGRVIAKSIKCHLEMYTGQFRVF